MRGFRWKNKGFHTVTHFMQYSHAPLCEGLLLENEGVLYRDTLFARPLLLYINMNESNVLFVYIRFYFNFFAECVEFVLCLSIP